MVLAHRSCERGPDPREPETGRHAGDLGDRHPAGRETGRVSPAGLDRARRYAAAGSTRRAKGGHRRVFPGLQRPQHGDQAAAADGRRARDGGGRGQGLAQCAGGHAAPVVSCRRPHPALARGPRRGREGGGTTPRRGDGGQRTGCVNARDARAGGRSPRIPARHLTACARHLHRDAHRRRLGGAPLHV